MLNKSKKNLCIWFFGVACLLYFYFPSTMYWLQNKNVNQVAKTAYPNIVSDFKDCIKKHAATYHETPTIFFVMFIVCIRTHLAIDELDMDDFPNFVNGESKIFLPLKNPDESCKWLTVGIGGSEKAEELFKKQYPSCLVYGVEPSNQGNFSKIGEVLPNGIGNFKADIGALSLEDNITKIVLNVGGKYFEKEFQVMSLLTVLDTFVHSRFIHYLTIDIEGFEYKILEQLVGDGKFTKQNSGITICQIDAELHNPQMDTIHSEVKTLNPVDFILHFLQHSSPYIPIYNAPFTHHPHQKVSFINIQDPECEAAFGFSSYFKTDNKFE